MIYIKKWIAILTIFSSAAVLSQDLDTISSSKLKEDIINIDKRVIESGKNSSNLDIDCESTVYKDHFNLVSFRDTIFTDIYFNETVFIDRFNFSIKVKGSFDIYDSKFKIIDLRSSHFIDEFYFEDSVVKESGIFIGVQYYSVAGFSGSQFEDDVFFSRTTFHDDVLFDDVIFNNNSTVWFDYVEFISEVNFENITLPSRLRLKGFKSKNRIDLTQTKLGNIDKKCHIDLIDAPIDKIKMRYDQFLIHKPDNLYSTEIGLAKKTYEKLTNVYEGLLNNFKNDGYISSYEQLDKEYQEFKFIENPELSFGGRIGGKILNFINWA